MSIDTELILYYVVFVLISVFPNILIQKDKRRMRMKHNGRLKVKFDFSFFAVVAFMIFIDTSGAAVLSLIACILHEGGHLLAMAVCGANPERITFYGGGIALSKSGMESLTDAKPVSYTHLRAHEPYRRQRQMCIRDSVCRVQCKSACCGGLFCYAGK